MDVYRMDPQDTMKTLIFNIMVFTGLNLSVLIDNAWAQSGIYQEGQVWVIESGDYQGVEVIIAHVEDHPRLDEVIHVMIPDPIENLDGTISSQMSHIPFCLLYTSPSPRD